MPAKALSSTDREANETAAELHYAGATAVYRDLGGLSAVEADYVRFTSLNPHLVQGVMSAEASDKRITMDRILMTMISRGVVKPLQGWSEQAKIEMAAMTERTQDLLEVAVVARFKEGVDAEFQELMASDALANVFVDVLTRGDLV